MRRLPLIAAALTLAIAVPAHADEAEWAGFFCGFELSQTTEMPDGRTRYTADVRMGPWYAADLLADDASGPGDVAAARITFHCVVQKAADAQLPGERGHHGLGSVHATADGYVDTEKTLTYYARPGTKLYLCSFVEMVHGSTRELAVYDEDDNDGNGKQCAVAETH